MLLCCSALSCAGREVRLAQDASLELASGGDSEACVQHASKAAKMLRSRLEVVLSQAGSPGLGSPREATMASAVASLDELNSSLQLRDEARELKQCLMSEAMALGLRVDDCCAVAGSAGAASRRGSCAGRCGRAPWRGCLRWAPGLQKLLMLHQHRKAFQQPAALARPRKFDRCGAAAVRWSATWPRPHMHVSVGFGGASRQHVLLQVLWCDFALHRVAAQHKVCLAVSALCCKRCTKSRLQQSCNSSSFRFPPVHR